VRSPAQRDSPASSWRSKTKRPTTLGRQIADAAIRSARRPKTPVDTAAAVATTTSSAASRAYDSVDRKRLKNTSEKQGPPIDTPAAEDPSHQKLDPGSLFYATRSGLDEAACFA